MQVKPTPIESLRKNASVSSKGIAILVDTVGDIEAVNESLPLMKHDGHIVSAGFYGTEGMIDIQKLRRGEQTLHCPSGWSRPAHGPDAAAHRARRAGDEIADHASLSGKRSADRMGPDTEPARSLAGDCARMGLTKHQLGRIGGTAKGEADDKEQL